MLADLDTPVSIYMKLKKLKPIFLLESVEGGKQIGRYSYIGLLPKEILKVKQTDSLEQVFRDHISTQSLNSIDDDTDLAGGLVGVINYNAINEFLPLKNPLCKTSKNLKAIFAIPQAVLIFDHAYQKISISHIEGKEQEENLLQQVKSLLQNTILHDDSEFCYEEPKSTVNKTDFIAMVTKAKEYIENGDIFQVVLSRSFEGTCSGNSFNLYRQLRQLNPSSYLFYFDFGDIKAIGSSPEALVRHQEGKVIVKPIAGTKKRGKDSTADSEIASDLLSDDKENAEHNMLVDLGRNDLGRFAMPRSVKVDSYREIEKYSHVMHMTSEVSCVPKPNATVYEILKSTFPAGTVSGAPKIRALEIIDELESIKRNFYSGSVGYITRKGFVNQAIAIRTIFIDNDKYSIQAGAGIVANSNPESEYDETSNKAAALLEALRLASSKGESNG